MALRCSLLGHDYDDPTVQRDREERGSEVVVTVTEFQRCQRCGVEKILSENTEVTSLENGHDLPDSPAPVTEGEHDSVGDEHPAEASEPTPSGDDAVAADTALESGADTPPDEDVEILDSEADPSDTASSDPGVASSTESATAADSDVSEGTDADEPDVPTDEDGDPITDDAEILDETEPPRDGDRGHGEWPDSDDVGPPVGAANEQTAWPDDDGTDDAADLARQQATAGEPVESTGPRDLTEEATQPPAAEEDEPVTDDAVFVDAEADSVEGQSASYTGIESAQSAPNPGESTTRDGVATEFFCPQCSFVAPGDRGSLRQGDICPECKRGYLGERER
ncbi:hypothetical protein OB919_03250 [Halobacteria archaeon AArc-curdl1]|uniref:Uncharacterized protein n=1 Tax=Natronosalvus hydrolyticus TaxID=2979988 RepID=A0AAP2Z5A9_9EURY|nr:hypothetical protein [Halobacteria archaeon AArc-curdl1]